MFTQGVNSLVYPYKEYVRSVFLVSWNWLSDWLKYVTSAFLFKGAKKLPLEWHQLHPLHQGVIPRSNRSLLLLGNTYYYSLITPATKGQLLALPKFNLNIYHKNIYINWLYNYHCKWTLPKVHCTAFIPCFAYYLVINYLSKQTGSQQWINKPILI